MTAAIFSRRVQRRTRLTDDELTDVLAHVWLDEYVRNSLCMICGNSGVIDTRATMCGDHAHIKVVGPVGQVCEGVAHCVCPNGRRLKQLGAPLP